MPEASLGPEALIAAVGRGSVESKVSLFNTAVTADTDIITAALVAGGVLSPTYPPCLFRIYACFDTAGVLTLRRTSGGVTVSEQLNAGSNLEADAAYLFDVVVDSGETVNLRYSVNATLLKLSIIEISGGA